MTFIPACGRTGLQSLDKHPGTAEPIPTPHPRRSLAGHGDTANHPSTHELSRIRDPTSYDMSEQQSFMSGRWQWGDGPPGEQVSPGCRAPRMPGWEAGGWCFCSSLPALSRSPPTSSPAPSCYSLGCVGSGNASNQASRRESRPGAILKEEGL